MRKTLTFDDVLITPQFSTIASRKECDTRTNLTNLSFPLPIISSNMDTITEDNMASAMTREGGIGALHRFMTIEKNIEIFKKCSPVTFVSIGLGPNELDRANLLNEAGAANFIIDVANGASTEVAKQFIALRKIVGVSAHIMVGNFATAESILRFEQVVSQLSNGYSKWPDSFKVGIGGGSMCSTRIVTGCGMPTLASVLDCASTGYDIVADGGIRNSGDIAKALAAGAKAVMIGGLLAGTDETPGDVINQGAYESWHPTYSKSEIKYKKYRGSASKESYEVQGKIASHRAPEGESTLVPYKGPVAPILQELKAGLQSAMSYVDARNLSEFRENAHFMEVTSNGVLENKPHGKKL